MARSFVGKGGDPTKNGDAETRRGEIKQMTHPEKKTCP